MHLRRRL